MTTYDEDYIAKERGGRLRMLRKLAGLRRHELAKEASVSKASISYWENASLSRLSEKGADKVIKVIQQKSIDCSIEWLLYGIGLPPKAKSVNEDIITLTSLITLEQEIELFLTNKNSVTTTMHTQAMQPSINVDDTIGGIWCDISVIGNRELIAIVKIGKLLQVRKVKKSPDSSNFDLSYLSYSHDLKEPFELKDVPLAEIAPVIRIWRKN